ncbi:transcriptional regulator [Sinorhizobium meliloti]|uniref:MucR n=1 Tax=Sinorhizobium meliloti (strain SM11) TaxID=707241 RepID=Q1WLH7_SINMM|nr:MULTISPECIES: MucR family transcriptional regulator [Sinorhizobium]ABA56023.1 MucR [Sinorhizobium meliloti]ARS66094.1 transcriptional regulator [Sinorhizobium meliloti RU11/001]MBP2471063.1 putative transcriptional regulator [Sinorhizobium meliloti]MCM5688565.1 MucR family transcriptional regulator [Sinorhizobium meliloti]MDE3768693.1 MucR family transcriptional regulator [Sinorhizobium meliloti]
MSLLPPQNGLLVTLTAEIVSAYVKKHVIRGVEVTKIITDVHAALSAVGSDKVVPEPVEKPKPPVPVRKSIQDGYLICLENGKKFKSLKRHLMAKYQMTPEQYRTKWDLPDDYPMVAPAYAAKRSELAKSAGLGYFRKKRAA